MNAPSHPSSDPSHDPSLVAKVLATHDALAAAGVGHAFGGALALAYWTGDPRTTADIDINISVTAADGLRVLNALPVGVTVPADAPRRPKDWLDIDAMRQAGSIDAGIVIDRVAAIVGAEDHRIGQLRNLGRH